jgi:Arc/MetJ-type ribon-helix-helix transcriptional regulator
MTVQITVRLPDDLVAFVDAEVARGDVSSRADAVARALVRERRRRTALADVAILRGSPGDPELDGLAEYTAAHPVALDD